MQLTEPAIPVARTTLAATCRTVPNAAGVVLIHPATAVTQGFYAAFADYLAGRGLNVITYDYRGTGRSRPASLRGVEVTMADWIDEDVPAVTAWAKSQFPELPLVAVGHSVGGHALALSPSTNGLRAAMLVAAHAGATHTVRGWFERQRVRFVLSVLAPVLCRVLGYMPGKRIGLGEDLPRGVMLQWSGWCASRRYFFDDPKVDAARRMAQVRVPLQVLSFTDDPWANPAAVDMLVSPLPQARLQRREVAPREAGVPGIGHMGFFRRRCEAGLWAEAADWLLAHCSQEERAHA
ncbi:alpha/beta fold hydrolase [Massilia sp. ST3]|uniref:alpha/beta hydrolase family protein n=1 Tax=Massilia sp. ST3 TaxID=2824903 RepID=UPI001B82F6BE|nr:alpha/beta fold hydrolase [Massilia sp. ST3]MBQ5946649.1 alpha/beta fold hydrolase [Massilia sp. ST3]